MLTYLTHQNSQADVRLVLTMRWDIIKFLQTVYVSSARWNTLFVQKKQKVGIRNKKKDGLHSLLLIELERPIKQCFSLKVKKMKFIKHQASSIKLIYQPLRQHILYIKYICVKCDHFQCFFGHLLHNTVDIIPDSSSSSILKSKLPTCQYAVSSKCRNM